MNRTISIIVGVVIAALLAGGCFWEGMNVGKAQASADQSSFYSSRGFPNGAGGTGGTGTNGGNSTGTGTGGTGGTGFGGRGGGAAGANGAAGTVTAVNGDTITMTTTQGTTVTVQIPANTPILKSVAGSTSDIQVGSHLTVIGARSGDNIAATGVQLTDRPAGFNSVFGGGRRNGTPTVPTATPAPSGDAPR